jgi:protein-S-isoprenylcysteine O-methyltransferase Ste14
MKVGTDGTKMILSESNQNSVTMGNFLYLIAIILVIGWALGFLVYSAGSLIHILLVIALIAIILRLIRGERI